MIYLPYNTSLQGNKYKILRFIGAGGFGCTYEGVHTMLNTNVAIKEFFPKMFCNREENTLHVSVPTKGNHNLVAKLRKKFNEEAVALFRMKHENIVRVLDVFEENGTVYYVMEYVNGRSLYEIVKERGALPEAEALGYIRQVAEALKYVHSLNRLHLDIKPSNIMIDKYGKAILIDFGASKHYDDESGENTSSLLGVNTKGYAPIEQSTQSFSTFSPATDIYALGATLYKLLTGITPPDANLLVIEEETLQPLSPKISISTQQAVTKSLNLRRKERPQSIDEFLELVNPNCDVDDVIEIDEVTAVDELTAIDEVTAVDEETVIDYSPVIDVEVVHYTPMPSRTNSVNIHEGHEWVDLGLPSGLKWATCNIGATRASDYGDLFAWGETEPKSEYTESNSETFKKGKKFFFLGSRFNWLRKYGYIDNYNNLTDIHDAAACNWGGKWRMPTEEEMEELVENCDWKCTTLNGRNGYLVTGRNGNSIFLPVEVDDIDEDENYLADYWCSTLDTSTSDFKDAFCLSIIVDNNDESSNDYDIMSSLRYLGNPIRPVLSLLR